MYKINELIKLNKRLYHTADLAVLWHITNKNTLYTTIKRYVQQGILIPVYKGLYSTLPLNQLDPLELGRAIIHNYAYLSTESVLANNGIINQAVYAHTFITSASKKITVTTSPGNIATFLYRQLKDEYLYNPLGIKQQNDIFVASTERAVADLLYFVPKYHFDLPEMVDWQQVRYLQKQIGYKASFVPCYNSTMSDKDKIIQYWLFGSADALSTAEALYKSGKYNFCLFFCHLALEKRLKAVIIETTDDAAPYSHKLTLLAKLAKLPLSEAQLSDLDTITEFNLDARYEEYKLEFYHRATKTYCDEWFTKSKELLQWINTQSAQTSSTK